MFFANVGLQIMKKIKYLSIQFKNELSFNEIGFFRGAVVAAVGREMTLFHNHQGEGFRYSYPLIQYKRVGQQVALICLEDGVHDVHAFFMQRPAALRVGTRMITPEVESLQMKEVTLQAWDKMFSYRINNWLALSQDNYPVWQEMPDEAERTRFLMTILRGNLLSMAKGLGWHVDREIKVHIDHISPMRFLHYKEQRLSGFDVRFSTNIWLPQYMGLGKGAAMGFGMVQSVKIRQNPKNDDQRNNLPGGTPA